MYYVLDENSQILMAATFKFQDDCLETNKKIVRGFNGKLMFEEDTQTNEYITAKKEHNNQIENKKLLELKKERLSELTKDLAQVQVGLVIDDLEQRKAEFRTLLNEVRVLQGKEPREINGG